MLTIISYSSSETACLKCSLRFVPRMKCGKNKNTVRENFTSMTKVYDVYDTKFLNV